MDRDLCVLGPVTSLLVWRAARGGLIGLPRQDEAQPDLALCHARVREVRQVDLVRAMGEVPLDVIVGSRARSHNGTLRSIYLAGKMPPGSFRHVGEGLYVCTPELCFALLGRGGQVLRLAELGLELCGAYSLAPDQSGRFCSCPALTKKKRLASYLDLLGHRHGLVTARKALDLVTDGPASPRETSLYLMFVTPVRMGGYGFQRPELNAKVGIRHQATGSPLVKACMVDQLFRDDKGKKILVVDGIKRRPPAGARQAEGAGRTDGATTREQHWEALARDGLDVVVMDRSDTMSMGGLEAKALRIGRLLGRPMHVTRGLARQRRLELFGLLFDDSRWQAEHAALCQLAGYSRPATRERRVA